MSRLTIDTGTAGNPATGDSLRGAFTKVNTNFAELYAELGGDSLDAISFTNNTISTDITNANLILTGNGTGGVVIEDIEITGSTVNVLTTNNNLTLTTNGTGKVIIGGFGFSGNILSTTDSNANIELDPAGTGDMILKSGNFLPATDNTQYLGSASKRWHTLYVGPGSINIDGVTLSASGGKLNMGADIEVNAISSADSSAIQINDGVNISGNVHLQGETITMGNITASSVDQSLTTIYGAFGLYDHSGNYSMAMSTSGAGDAGGGGQMIFEGNNSSGYALVPSNNNQYTLGRPEVAGPGSAAYWKNLYVYNVNFPDLTEQTTAARITVVGDDSTGTTFNAGETVKIAGTQNITTAVSGDILTITGPDLSNYATQSYVDTQVGASNTLTIADDSSTSISINLDNTLEVLGASGISTSVSGSTLTITGPDLSNYLTAVPSTIAVNEISSSDSSAIQINDGLNVSGSIAASSIVADNLLTGLKTSTIVAGVLTLDFTFGTHIVNHNANISSISFTNASAVKSSQVTVILTQDATGGRTITGSYATAGGLGLDISTAANAVNIISFFTRDNSTFYGFSNGKNFS